jgi:hypothetical protein
VPGGVRVEALFEFLFGGMFDRMFCWLFSCHLRRQVKELQQHNQAQRTGPFLRVGLGQAAIRTATSGGGAFGRRA